MDDRTTGANSGFKKWWLTSKIESMSNKFIFVTGNSDEFQTSPLLKPATRYVSGNNNHTKTNNQKN